jgi:hypothetical protein
VEEKEKIVVSFFSEVDSSEKNEPIKNNVENEIIKN